jgi:hypothetical protein
MHARRQCSPAAALEQSALLELVDKRNDATRRDAQRTYKYLLRLALCSRDVQKHGRLANVESQPRQTLCPDGVQMATQS